MKKLILLMVAFSFGGWALGQSRATVITDKVSEEGSLPESLKTLVDTSLTAALVRIDGKTTTLNASGFVVVLYQGRVAGTLEIGERLLNRGESIQFYENGGVFNNGRIIRMGDMRNQANLEPGATYIVFLTQNAEKEYQLYWGRYGAFQVVSGVIVPVCPVDHSLFKEIAGLYLQDFQTRIESEAGKARVGSGQTRKQSR